MWQGGCGGVHGRGMCMAGVCMAEGGMHGREGAMCGGCVW